MLRSNLATRPFYNERAVHLLLALAAILVVALTAFNLMQIVSMSRHNTELSSRTDADRSEAQRLTADAQRIRAGINREELQTIVTAAQAANELIDQRTFSWTAFFNHIESTLPPDVMLTTVQPSFTESSTVISMNVLAREAEDIEAFMDELEETGAFEDVLPQSEDRTEEGLHRVLLRAIYTAVVADAPADAPPEAPAPAVAPNAAGQRGGRGR